MSIETFFFSFLYKVDFLFYNEIIIRRYYVFKLNTTLLTLNHVSLYRIWTPPPGVVEEPPPPPSFDFGNDHHLHLFPWIEANRHHWLCGVFRPTTFERVLPIAGNATTADRPYFRVRPPPPLNLLTVVATATLPSSQDDTQR